MAAAVAEGPSLFDRIVQWDSAVIRENLTGSLLVEKKEVNDTTT